MKANDLAINSTIDLIIFDCDGVLVDSEVLSQRVLIEMLAEIGVTVSQDYFLTHFLGYNFEHVTAKVFSDFSVKLTAEFRENYRDKLIKVFAVELQQTQDLAWMLSQINVKTCVATSGSPEKVKNSLHYTKLEQYFGNRVFTSSEVKNGKPAPDLFLHAANKMAVSPQNCLVIEDSNAGVRAGLAANMHVIRYTGASHLSGLKTTMSEDVTTIDHWTELFEQIPSLSSSTKIER